MSRSSVESKPPASAPRKRLSRLHLALLVFLAVSWLGSEFARNANEQISRLVPEVVTNTSTYNGQPTGYRAFFELCGRAGLKTERWQRPYRELSGKRGTLVIVAPAVPQKDFEVEQIFNWVAEGNRLVYLDYFTFRTGRRFLKKLSVSAAETRALTQVSFNAPPTALMEHVGALSLSAETRLNSTQAAADALIKDGQGALLMTVPYGKGQCLVGSTPGICANGRIAEPQSRGNFQFLSNWLHGNDPVFFDEKCHGYSQIQNFFIWVMRSPTGAVINQGLLIFCLALLSLNQRFGPQRVVSRARKISNLEFIDGMAHAYRKARATDTAWSILFTSFKVRLCKALSVSPEERPEQIAAKWSECTGIKEEACREFLMQAIAAESARISGEELVRLSGRCDELSQTSKNFLSLTGSRRAGA